jgi:hypothetical protein
MLRADVKTVKRTPPQKTGLPHKNSFARPRVHIVTNRR